MKFFEQEVRKIAVFRALQLGDMLCSIPAMRALRAGHPQAEITLLGLPWAESFCRRFEKYFDRFIHFPGFPGLPEQAFDPAKWKNFEEQMRAENFDMILQMQGNGSIVNEMLENLQAGTIVGFHSGEYSRSSGSFLPYPTGISEISRHIALMEHLGIGPRGTHLEFPISGEEVDSLYRKFPFIQEGNFICVHPGSRGAWRQWPTSHFACLADLCAGRGFKVLITGTWEESVLAAQVMNQMDYPAIDMTGKTQLGVLAQLINDADLLISNCTGVSHIAAATATPSIVISMDGEPERWAPLNHHLHKTIDWTREQSFENVAKWLPGQLRLAKNRAISIT